MGTHSIKLALENVNEIIFQAVNKRLHSIPNHNKLPRLVAVSKFQPVELIIEAYNCGQRYFGENYIQELAEKSNSHKIVEECPDIKWHFIGRLQSNKVNKLLKVPNLYMIETIDSEKLASLVNKAFSPNEVENDTQADTSLDHNRMKVMVQVKTSDEDTKSGVELDSAVSLARYIHSECPALELSGLMTIGKLGGWGPGEKNLDFVKLSSCRENICKELNIEPEFLELSMGMSGDFEEASAI
ncbi:Pyridoxal phosphate homeostasis protein, partial [Fragariocoptes setiger]